MQRFFAPAARDEWSISNRSGAAGVYPEPSRRAQNDTMMYSVGFNASPTSDRAAGAALPWAPDRQHRADIRRLLERHDGCHDRRAALRRQGGPRSAEAG